jgi:peptide-methionine (S)-S-oxide reductase
LKYFLIYFIFLISSIINQKKINGTEVLLQKNNKEAYFASGCFWCVEAIFESLKGVEEVYSGYSGGVTINPSYREVMSGNTGHAETVEIIYNPKIIDFKTLVKVFFESHDPTTKDSQGPDFGSQYRSIAFYNNENEKEIIKSYIEDLNKNVFENKIVTEIIKFQKFYYAETYHQDFEKKNPNNLYINKVSIPRINNFKNKMESLLKINN